MSMRTYDATSYASQGDYPTDSQQDDSVSVFDRYSSFDGTFNLTRDLRVEGQVKGTINCQGTLFVAQGASVNATVEAENLTVAGDLDGDVTCRGRLQILSTGKVHGKLITSTLVINEGAVYEGELVMDNGRATSSTRELSRSRLSPPAASAAANSTESTRPAAETSSAGSGVSNNTFIRRFGGQETTWDNTDAESDQESNPSY
jgi:cytoskeletal protein CcmA (bactofilin family)